MANQPIPVAQANVLIQNYNDYMTALNVSGQTESVGFDAAALLAWIDSVKDYADEFRIFFGVYDSSQKKGRLTSMIWPYKEGEPATRPEALRTDGEGGEGGEEGGTGELGGGAITLEPFNEGHLRP